MRTTFVLFSILVLYSELVNSYKGKVFTKEMLSEMQSTQKILAELPIENRSLQTDINQGTVSNVIAETDTSGRTTMVVERLIVEMDLEGLTLNFELADILPKLPPGHDQLNPVKVIFYGLGFACLLIMALIGFCIPVQRQYFWCMLSTMQIYVHYLLVDAMMPQCLVEFFQALMNPIRLGLFDSYAGFGIERPDVNGKFALNDSFAQGLYFSTNFSVNLIHVLFTGMIILAILAIMLFFAIMISCCRKDKSLKQNAKDIAYQVPHRFLLVASLEIFLCSLISFSSHSQSSRVLLYTFLGMMAYLIIVMIFIASSDRANLQKESSFRRRFGVLYDTLRLKAVAWQTNLALLYPLGFLVRRFLFSCILVLLRDQGIYQIILIICLNLSSLQCVGYVWPFIYRSRNIIEILDECVLLAMACLMIEFTWYEDKEETRYETGYAFMFIFLIHIGYHTTFQLTCALIHARNRYKYRQELKRRNMNLDINKIAFETNGMKGTVMHMQHPSKRFMSDDVENSYFNQKQHDQTEKLDTVEEVEDSARSSCRLQHEFRVTNTFSGLVSLQNMKSLHEEQFCLSEGIQAQVSQQKMDTYHEAQIECFTPCNNMIVTSEQSQKLSNSKSKFRFKEQNLVQAPAFQCINSRQKIKLSCEYDKPFDEIQTPCFDGISARNAEDLTEQQVNIPAIKSYRSKINNSKKYKTIEYENEVKIPHELLVIEKKECKPKKDNGHKIKNPLLKQLASSMKSKGVFSLKISKNDNARNTKSKTKTFSKKIKIKTPQISIDAIPEVPNDDEIQAKEEETQNDQSKELSVYVDILDQNNDKVSNATPKQEVSQIMQETFSDKKKDLSGSRNEQNESDGNAIDGPDFNTMEVCEQSKQKFGANDHVFSNISLNEGQSSYVQRITDKIPQGDNLRISKTFQKAREQTRQPKSVMNTYATLDDPRTQRYSSQNLPSYSPPQNYKTEKLFQGFQLQSTKTKSLKKSNLDLQNDLKHSNSSFGQKQVNHLAIDKQPNFDSLSQRQPETSKIMQDGKQVEKVSRPEIQELLRPHSNTSSQREADILSQQILQEDKAIKVKAKTREAKLLEQILAEADILAEDLLQTKEKFSRMDEGRN